MSEKLIKGVRYNRRHLCHTGWTGDADRPAYHTWWDAGLVPHFEDDGSYTGPDLDGVEPLFVRKRTNPTQTVLNWILDGDEDSRIRAFEAVDQVSGPQQLAGMISDWASNMHGDETELMVLLDGMLELVDWDEVAVILREEIANLQEKNA